MIATYQASDPEVKEILHGLAFGTRNAVHLLENLVCLAADIKASVPSVQTDGGRHEVDPQEQTAVTCPAFFPQKERMTLGTPKRRVALRLTKDRPIIDQLREAVAKIEARA
jgi:hypothetical protein